ncbi:uncharacterized protein K489DRAFT_434885 [Dissoconium aciculare CBS 342.82]|uniref:Uncharacterized protein n=1 Tax=Dissoconium aciculare CBS 342.82 TaxID=1314786 RepID=A0A6J3LSR6_9PEZI|nr:uncharacterized protein K489DRAFT_434885 [Dissoconium aciculare CBS 342.82]KAF1818673.1 hypothetical protein K489DRAFT_434885 [Dissoconium aciculare CBS 342.82]
MDRLLSNDPTSSTTVTRNDPAPPPPPPPTNSTSPSRDPNNIATTTTTTTTTTKPLSCKNYATALLINLTTFLLPALYSTLSKFWVSQLHARMLATTDVYSYIGIVAEVLNEGLPRAAWSVIGDAANRTLRSRRQLAFTLIAAQSIGSAGCAVGDRHVFTLLESAIRNALYLWLGSGVVAVGLVYTTAWSVFNTIRWGLIIVPIQALEATALTFVGHRWGAFRNSVGMDNRRPTASKRQIYNIVSPALQSCLIALAFEVPVALFLSFYGARRFAHYISSSEEVSVVTERMWRTIDWCYIFYAVSTQLATILLATGPLRYLYQSLVNNLCWVLSWAVAVSRIGITPDDAWKYHSIVFGGSLVFSFLDIALVVVIWAWMLLSGKVHLLAVTRAGR